MPPLSFSSPAEAGFDADGLRRLDALMQRMVQEDRLPAAGLCIGNRGRAIAPMAFGQAKPDSLFLVASLTKPVTVAAVMMLVERGRITLDDRVAEFVPKFAAAGKDGITIRHLMTHTSGLPDMPPNNLQLRKDRRPLAAFVEDTLPIAPLFEPGAGVNYQSMGTLMLGEVVHQVGGMSLPEFLAKELFGPLGMNDTSLGFKKESRARILPVRLPRTATGHEAVWNSEYWLGLGAPWGGLITTPADYARFLLMFQGEGQFGGVRVLSPQAVRAMTTNQLAVMPRVPEEDRRCRPWGLGWRLNWSGVAATFGDLLGPRAFGHWGATGTLAWCDPERGAFAVILTTRPLEEGDRTHVRLSNAIAAAMA